MALIAHALPLQGAGEALMVTEAGRHDFFMPGELHGEVEIPALLRDLWPQLWPAGYRHVRAEVSPWAAEHLENPDVSDRTPIIGLWTRDQAATVHQFAVPSQNVLWGCDIEKAQPERLIREMARVNPDDATIQTMVHTTDHGYTRKQAHDLLRLAETDKPTHDELFNGISLWRILHYPLQVENLRSNGETDEEAEEDCPGEAATGNHTQKDHATTTSLKGHRNPPKGWIEN